MAAALNAVGKGGLTANRSADTHAIPSRTLKDTLSGRVTPEVKSGP